VSSKKIALLASTFYGYSLYRQAVAPIRNYSNLNKITLPLIRLGFQYILSPFESFLFRGNVESTPGQTERPNSVWPHLLTPSVAPDNSMIINGKLTAEPEVQSAINTLFSNLETTNIPDTTRFLHYA
jgi:hypothetical protein